MRQKKYSLLCVLSMPSTPFAQAFAKSSQGGRSNIGSDSPRPRCTGSGLAIVTMNNISSKVRAVSSAIIAMSEA